jgi:hypothetical protein
LAATDQQPHATAAASQNDVSNTSSAGGSGEAPAGADVSQGNGATAAATASAAATTTHGSPGQGRSAGDGPAQASSAASNGSSHSAAVAQDVGAAAGASQQGVTNAAVSIRNGAPGNDGAVVQTNEADATASAAASASGEGVDAVQHVAASAQAQQTDVSNTNASVRVGSSGNSGPVSQSNTATATSAAAANADHAPPQAQSWAAQDGATNTNVSVRVFSPGSDGPVGQSNVAAAEATGDDASSTATQNGVRNTNVLIRVASPGHSGEVTQGSSTTEAIHSSDAETENLDIENHDGDTHVRVDIAGDDLSDPTVGADGLVTVWRWTWRWSQVETEAVQQGGVGWSWSWGTAPPAAGEPSVVSVPLAPGLDVGSFVWSWEWERAGDWSWSWNLATRLDCTCIWIWDWVWQWEGAATSAPSDGAGSAPSPAVADVEQRNVVVAVAEAAVASDSAQTVDTGEQAGSSFAGQIVDTTQVATADALATQGDSRNRLRGAGVQSSVVVVDAFAGGGAMTDQAISQHGDGDAGTSQWAGQQIVVDQIVGAVATADQQGAANVGASGHSVAVAEAAAIAVAVLLQEIVQYGSSLGGTQDEWAGQRTDVIQTAGAFADTAQRGTRGNAAATAAAIGTAELQATQSALQLAVGAAGIRSQRAAQLAGIGQASIASALTADGFLLWPTGGASSFAVAQNAGLVGQHSTQHLEGSGGIDLQDATQNAFLGQIAVAASTSAGGHGGIATVINCATVGQASAQGIGMAAGAALGDRSGFCARPGPAPSGADGSASAGTSFEPAAPAAQPAVTAVGAAADAEVGPEHGSVPHGSGSPSRRSKKPTAVAPFTPPTGAAHDPGAPVPAPAAVAEARGDIPQISAAVASAPPSGRGGKAAGRDQTGPPLGWPQGLLNGAESASPLVPGGSGMAAAMAAFLLVLMGGSRVYTGSVVRRPTPFALRPETPG